MAATEQFTKREPARKRLDRMFQEHKSEAEPYEELWRQIADFLLPDRPRFLHQRRDKRRRAGNSRILDNTALQALTIAKSGLLAQEASPAGKWFQLMPTKPGLMDEPGVLEWLDKVRDILLTVFDRSNLYNALGDLFEDELAFGTAAMGQFANADNVLRFEVFPIGSYFLGNDSKGDVVIFCREFTMTARQLLARFGEKAISKAVKRELENGGRESKVRIRHIIMPNNAAGRGAGSKFLPYHEIYWEKENGISQAGELEDQPFSGAFQDVGENGGILQQAGYHEFPIIVLRWGRDTEDVYANRCPGIDALGDIKQLQEMVRVFTNGTEKMVNPPIIGGPGLEGRPVTMVPGAKTIDPDMAGGGTGARELHQTRLPLRDLSEFIQRIQDRIERTFMLQLFLAILRDTRGTPATAEEVRARVEEKSTILGPIQERHSDDGYDKIIDRGFNMLVRLSEPDWKDGEDGILPQPPQALADEDIRVRYVSQTAQAQRTVAIGSVERHAQFVGGLAEIHPGALDVFNPDEAVRKHAEANNVPPEITNSKEIVAELRAQRQEQQQQQAMAQAAPGLAKAAKDSASAVPQEGSVLESLMPGLAG